MLLGGRRLVDRAVQLLLDGGCAQVLAVLRPGQARASGARTVVNPKPDRGMGSSLRCALAVLEDGEPQKIAVFGTSLIRGPLLSMGRLGLLNLHGGLSPNYRGADCTFWALYHGEPHQVGCTIHFIDAGIDTGKLVAHVCPAIKSGDDELTLFWRAVRDAANVYAEAIRRFGNDRLRHRAAI